MTKKAVISIDLAAVVGTTRLKMPAQGLPRHNKPMLELTIASLLLQSVQSRMIWMWLSPVNLPKPS